MLCVKHTFCLVIKFFNGPNRFASNRSKASICKNQFVYTIGCPGQFAKVDSHTIDRNSRFAIAKTNSNEVRKPNMLKPQVH